VKSEGGRLEPSRATSSSPRKAKPPPLHQERLPFTFNLLLIQTCTQRFMLGFPKVERGRAEKKEDAP